MRRLYALDALRGVAALIVFAHHAFWSMAILPALAVDLFFALSGFVLTRTYEARLQCDLTTAQFIGLRYRRLFLPLAVGTTLGLVLSLSDGAGPTAALPAYALALAFLPAVWLPAAFPLNLPAWSLFLELVANALHGAVFARLSDRLAGILLCLNALAAVALLCLGLGHWGAGFAAIVSCAPRELAWYLVGIVVFRRFGDAPFARFDWRSGAWLGALSYPLYAIHHPVLRLAWRAGASPMMAGIIALLAAAALAIVEVAFRSRRQSPPAAAAAF